MSASRPIQVLLIEDNAGDAALVRQVLSDYPEPVRLHVAANEEQALRVFSHGESEPDLIIQDLSILPLADAKWLASKKIPRVIFSSSADPRELDRAFALGACDYIQKPADLTEFAQAMFGILDRWAPQRAYRVAP
jgi:two-component system, chemotaxis family, response regulator Rcp1